MLPPIAEQEGVFRLYIRADSDAFADNPAQEISRILRDVARRLEAGEDFGHFRTLLDLNGNDVGRAKLNPTMEG